jgi:hypothetical protein
MRRFIPLLVACCPLCGSRALASPEIAASTAPRPPLSSSVIRTPASVTHLPTRTFAFSAWQKLNPVWWVRNADDPVVPDWYRAGKSCRSFTWQLRNPFHNFTFYVIGLADKPIARVGRYPGRVANPNGGWNWAVCRYKCWRLPFVDYHRGRFETYCGWRNGGNFGLKFNFTRRAKHKLAQATQPQPNQSPC